MSLLRSGVIGALVGDAFGVPYEGNVSDQIPELSLSFEIPPSFTRSHVNIEPGIYSDDGAQILCLLDSLSETNWQLDLGNFANKLYQWYTEGLWAVDGNVFDIGNQTRKSLEAYGSGVPIDQCGYRCPDGCGNGSLMRTLPIAFISGTNLQVVVASFLQSSVTHTYPTNGLCCALYSLWAKSIIEGYNNKFDALSSAKKWLKGYCEGNSTYEHLLHRIYNYDDISGHSFVMSSLATVIHIIMNTDNYVDAVLQAVRVGGDTDTTACLVGGIAGLLYGVESIPHHMVQNLRGMYEVYLLLDRADSQIICSIK